MLLCFQFTALTLDCHPHPYDKNIYKNYEKDIQLLAEHKSLSFHICMQLNHLWFEVYLCHVIGCLLCFDPGLQLHSIRKGTAVDQYSYVKKHIICYTVFTKLCR